MSHGKLIGIINGDDFYELDAVLHMTDERYQVVYGYCRLYRNNHPVDVMKNSHKTLDGGMIPHPSCFVTRAAYCDYGIFSERYKITADYELMLRFKKSEKVHFVQIHKILSNFRLGGLSSKMERHLKLEEARIRFRYNAISLKELLLQFYFYAIGNSFLLHKSTARILRA